MSNRGANGPQLGGRVRALRRRQKLSQSDLAARLGISTSYLNLIENNRRPLPAALLIRLAQLFEVELHTFSAREDAELTASLFEALSDPLLEGQDVLASEVREVVAASPALSRAIVALYRGYRKAQDSVESLSARVDEGEREGTLNLSHFSSEEVNDLIQRHMNYFPALEAGAERLWGDAALRGDDLYGGLVQYLRSAHGVEVRLLRAGAEHGLLRHFDPARRVLSFSELLPNRSRKMQLAYQIGLLSQREVLDQLTDDPLLASQESRPLARAALANYFAAAVLMPYEALLRAAREVRYDIEVIGRRFGASFEQVCHRLTTLRRPKAEGIPFHMVRMDVAGNISKRFSASGIAIARFSGACPRWNVFAAFSTPGMIRIQFSRMPDSTAYFCVARTVMADNHGYHTPPRVHAVALGCAAERARELVYADGLDLSQLGAAVPVGVSCRLCDRPLCEQRAFPPMQKPLTIDENIRGISPYAPVEAMDPFEARTD